MSPGLRHLDSMGKPKFLAPTGSAEGDAVVTAV
jgi:hypothetical protein